jgi:hypothetical protein
VAVLVATGVLVGGLPGAAQAATLNTLASKIRTLKIFMASPVGLEVSLIVTAKDKDP